MLPAAGSVVIRGVPPVVVGPEATPPVERELHPDEELLGVDAVELFVGAAVLLVPPGSVVPCVWVCGGSGDGWPGKGAAGLPVT